MLRGIYSAASAMSLSMQKMNLFSQNLSNSQTTGYKKKTYSVHSFQDMLVNVPKIDGQKGEKIRVATGSYIDDAGVRQRQGRLKPTGNSLDLAVMGEGAYFQLEVNDPKAAEQGADPRYTITRNGNFKINAQNYLVNQSGDYVLDTNNQRIRLLKDNNRTDQAANANQQEATLANVYIDKLGRIQGSTNAVSNQPTQIKLVNYVDDPNLQPDQRAEMQQILKKYGLNMPLDSELLQSLDPLAATAADGDKVSIQQGYLESSNVDITSEMIMMMMTSKDYDMSQKIISTEDKVLDKTINEMGRLQ